MKAVAAVLLVATACAAEAPVAPPPAPTTAPAPPPVPSTPSTAPATAPPPTVLPPRAGRGVARTTTTHDHRPAVEVEAPEGMEGAQAQQEARLACIRRWESNGNYGAVSASGKYRGAYQFDWRTWQSNGGMGDPAAASPAEQDRVAGLLLERRGLQPWPTPARRCA